MAERIIVTCEGCSGSFAVPSATAGRRIRCPRCREVISVAEDGLPQGSTNAVKVSRTPPSHVANNSSPPIRRSHPTETKEQTLRSSRESATFKPKADVRKKTRTNAEPPSISTSTHPDRNIRGKSSHNSGQGRPSGSHSGNAQIDQSDDLYEDDENLFAGLNSAETREDDYSAYATSSLPPRQKSTRKRSSLQSRASSGNESDEPGKGRQILGGIATMVAAVIWFFTGLYFGYLFFYPPVLFLLGLIAFVKGLLKI